MRKFAAPYDLKFEDKIFGGLLTLRQAGWILTPIIIGLMSFMNVGSYVKDGQLLWGKVIITLIITLLFVCLGIFIAFKKIHELSVDKYFLKVIKKQLSKNTIKYYE